MLFGQKIIYKENKTLKEDKRKNAEIYFWLPRFALCINCVKIVAF